MSEKVSDHCFDGVHSIGSLAEQRSRASFFSHFCFFIFFFSSPCIATMALEVRRVPGPAETASERMGLSRLTERPIKQCLRQVNFHGAHTARSAATDANGEHLRIYFVYA